MGGYMDQKASVDLQGMKAHSVLFDILHVWFCLSHITLMAHRFDAQDVDIPRLLKKKLFRKKGSVKFISLKHTTIIKTQQK